MLKTTLVVATKDQVSADVQGEAVILNLKSGVYFGLNPVGARVWELAQNPISVQAIEQAILDEYDVAPERVEQDVSLLLKKLADAGLVEVIHDETG